MAPTRQSKDDNGSPSSKGIKRLTVAGYKSIAREQTIDIRPLTLLAGANSSGKSSIMQPLLLLKQTLEASYDPGPLLLYGPILKFTWAEQLLSFLNQKEKENVFKICIDDESGNKISSFFNCNKRSFEIQQTDYESGKERVVLYPGVHPGKVESLLPFDFKESFELVYQKEHRKLEIIRNRCFLELHVTFHPDTESAAVVRHYSPGLFTNLIQGLVYLPGLRGSPERNYPITATGSVFPGSFEQYTASVIDQWQAEENKEKLRQLNKALSCLNLTWKVTARRINDAQVELQVSRLSKPIRSGAHDLVNIADVGVGVSQVLPVLVALLAAEPGQMVYLEQPEIHLRPRAQVALAGILAQAARRGVKVVAETHSHLLLLGVQTLVAEGEGKLAPELVKLHWFQRDEDGTTSITSADLDESGAFGEWPEDFADVALQAENRYLNAVESRASKT